MEELGFPAEFLGRRKVSEMAGIIFHVRGIQAKNATIVQIAVSDVCTVVRP